ncbi:MAG: hypothetical protein M0R23_00140 [Bacteroidales bacterium]|nr:hypothetical protein [Bacteroidales bacterium]
MPKINFNVEDRAEFSIDLNKILIKNPSSTFFARIDGRGMSDNGVSDGDVLIIDKSLNPKENSLVVCFLDGGFTLKRFNRIMMDLYQENIVWGVVIYIIKKV